MNLGNSLARMTIQEMNSPWLEKIKNAEKTCIIRDGTRKVHYKFDDNEEMAEEYNIETDVLVRRAWRRKGTLKKQSDWEVEVGDPEPGAAITGTNVGIVEASNMPYIVKRITKGNIEWRVRNLPYPVETYSITADAEANCIVIRTTNKKYFKKIHIPELERVGISPVQKNISFTHNVNVLIIVYKKPPEVIQAEQKVLAVVKSLKSIKDSDQPSCNPS